MSAEANKALIRQWLADIERRDFDAAFARLAPGFVAHLPGAPQPLDRDAFRAYAETFHAAFTNERTIIEEQVAEGDTVATRISYVALHSGELADLEPGGKAVRVMGVYVDRIIDGQIVEHSVVLDHGDLVRQISQER